MTSIELRNWIKIGALKIDKFPSWKGPMMIYMKGKSWYCWRDESYVMFQGAEPDEEIYHFKITTLS